MSLLRKNSGSPERYAGGPTQITARHDSDKGPIAPNGLASGIRSNFDRLRRGGVSVTEEYYVTSATLKAPVSIFSYPGAPKELRKLAEISAEDRMVVRVLSRGFPQEGQGQVPFFVEPYVAIDFTIRPNLRENPLTHLRISQIGNEDPAISIRQGQEEPESVDYSEELLRFFLNTLGQAKEKWGGVGDYISDLRELSIGKMDPQDFMTYVEDPMRFTAKHLRDLSRKSGEPATEHSFRAAKLLMLAGDFDRFNLAIVILHDNWEDAPDLQQGHQPYASWVAKSKKDISSDYGIIVANGVMDLTRRRGDSVVDEQAERRLYNRNLADRPQAGYLKIPDRTDNIETLDVLSPEDQIRILKETLAYVENIFMNKSVAGVNPKTWGNLMKRLARAIAPRLERHGYRVPELISALADMDYARLIKLGYQLV